ncbi:MAG: DUF885 domain-containing protein [Saprospiraceae bacterium]
MRNFLLLLLPIFALCSCGNQKKQNDRAKANINDIAENYYEERLSLYPFEAASAGDMRFNDQFPIDISDGYRAKLKTFYEKYKSQLEAIPSSDLPSKDKTSYDLLKWECDIALEELALPLNLMPINQFDAKHLNLPLLGSGSSTQPFKTVKDYDNWIKRASIFPMWADTAIQNMKRGIAEGIVLPKALAVKVLPQLKSVILPAEKSIFWNPVKEFPSEIEKPEQIRLRQAFKNLIEKEINPAYQRLSVFFEKDYIPNCRESSGIGDIPQGMEIYNHFVKLWTTSAISPDEIFELGQKEVQRIKEEMEKVKTEVGFKGDIKSFFEHVNHLPALHPYTKDQQAIDAFHTIHHKMQPQLIKLFDLTPKTAFEIRQTESFREASGSAEYQPGAPDGSRPGIFYCPVLDPKNYNVFQDEALFLHEAIPGHHYQCSLQAENTDLPRFRRFLWYGAYGEGWALYTESLGKELGLYTDPYQYFGKLGMEMHRAIRLVVDVGIHYKGWTREQAIAFSLENEAETEENTIAEIERYMAVPGQALSYKVGQLKIVELRQKSEKDLGLKFDIRKFHNETLKHGCLTLGIYEKYINDWISATK